MALLDGDNGMGHLVMTRAAELAIEKARTAGVAWVGARMSNHAGPASLYARKPVAHDMIGMYFAVGNANHLPPWGGLDMLLSTNPIAVAIPAGRERAGRARHGDDRRRVWQGEGQGAARRSDAGRLDDRSRRQAAHRPAPRRGGLSAADRRLQGLRARHSSSGCSPERSTAPRWARTSSTSIKTTPARPIPARRSLRSISRLSAMSMHSRLAWTPVRRSARQPPHAERRPDLAARRAEQRQAHREPRDGIPIAAGLRQNLDRLADDLGIETASRRGAATDPNVDGGRTTWPQRFASSVAS